MNTTCSKSLSVKIRRTKRPVLIRAKPTARPCRRRRRRTPQTIHRADALTQCGSLESIQGAGLIRIASVPASHVYVRHLASPDGAGTVTRLRDPVPADGAKVPGGWWPPLMLDPHWISQNHQRFDVFHIHFGFDAITTDPVGRVHRRTGTAQQAVGLHRARPAQSTSTRSRSHTQSNRTSWYPPRTGWSR